MKLFKKMLLVILFLGMMLPVYSAPETETAEEKDPLSEFKCPECGKTVDMAKEIKKLEKKLKKSKKKNKKKSKKKDKKDKKDKEKDAAKNSGSEKTPENKKTVIPKKMKCPKCKKVVPLPQPEAEKKAETAENSETAGTETGGNDSE